jgi:hypothetical protein
MRYLSATLEHALTNARQMAFVAGPRQVGKTTLAKSLLEAADARELYFNWDDETQRRAIVRDPSGFFRPGTKRLRGARRPRLALDEIHKYPRWKRFLKGFFDANEGEIETIVTGSGRLDVYQRGGDSLMGRYDLYHLHPFTAGERRAAGAQVLAEPNDFVSALLAAESSRQTEEALSEVERFSGFPEPLHAGRMDRLRKWRRAHAALVIREDLRDLTRIRELGLLESLVLLLPERIGSPLSVNALAVELGVAFNTVKLWLDALSRLYFLVEVRPFSGRLARTLRREAKIYLFDPTVVPEQGPRFENVVALHLLKLCQAWTDTGAGDFALHYVRDKEKREVDFLLTESRRPWLLVECKLSDASPASSLRYFAERLRPTAGAVQLVRHPAKPYAVSPARGIHVVPAAGALAMM